MPSSWFLTCLVISWYLGMLFAYTSGSWFNMMISPVSCVIGAYAGNAFAKYQFRHVSVLLDD